jgi:hypothetical protein
MAERGRRPARARRGRVLGVLLALTAAAAPPAAASWTDIGRATSRFTAAPDWVPPLVGATVIANSTGYLAGSIRQGGTYFVYATVADSGNPPSGVATEEADVTAITPSGTAIPLVAGAWSVGGVSYTHRSGPLLATTPLAEGPRPYSLTSVDAAGNGRTQSGFVVTVDNTVPTAVDIQTTNGAVGTQGSAEAGDTVTFIYSERVDPESILAGWGGAPVDVVVRIVDGGCLLVILSTTCASDSLVVYDAANATQLALGSVSLGRGDYHGTALGTAAPLAFGASGTKSNMVQSEAGVGVTLGTPSAAAGLAGAAGTMVWTPSTAAYDAAGNPVSASSATEGGPSDREF